MKANRIAPPGTPAPTPPPKPPKPPTGPGRLDDEYLTVVEVAEMWHCDRETVYAAVYAGQLPWIDLRSPGASRARIRIRRSAAHQYMADRERGAVAA
jgi:excisionase family DNA binding protein